METVLITGGTGMVGKALSSYLVREGYRVIILTRNKSPHLPSGGVSYAFWDPAKGYMDEHALKDVDHIINLAGAGVADKRWTKKRKKEISDSRTQAGQTLVQSLRRIPNKVRTVVQASAIGWYGPDPVPSVHPFTEEQPGDPSFLGATCKKWEESIAEVSSMHKRLVVFRIGIVLSRAGGALKEFIRPLPMGVAPILGKGDQIISWIHIDDLCRMFHFAIQKENLTGTYNAVAPHPVSNASFMQTLACLRNGSRYVAVHVPAFVLKIMMGEMSIEVLKSATVSAEKIKKAGFVFLFAELKDALRQLLAR